MEENKNNKVSKKEVINLLKCDDSNFPKCIFKDKKNFKIMMTLLIGGKKQLIMKYTIIKKHMLLCII